MSARPCAAGISTFSIPVDDVHVDVEERRQRAGVRRCSSYSVRFARRAERFVAESFAYGTPRKRHVRTLERRREWPRRGRKSASPPARTSFTSRAVGLPSFHRDHQVRNRLVARGCALVLVDRGSSYQVGQSLDGSTETNSFSPLTGDSHPEKSPASKRPFAALRRAGSR